MSASRPMPNEPGENKRNVPVYFTSRLPEDADGARVFFPRSLTVRESEFTIREGITTVLRIPIGRFRLRIDTLFPRSTKSVIVSADVVGNRIDSLLISQRDHHRVLIDVKHTQSAETEYCTVTCEATKESRTGIGACIDCDGPLGTVRLCC
jgi:hypothetical protein